MDPRPGLSDPATADHAWRRFRSILHYMNLVSIMVAGAGVGLIAYHRDGLPWLFAGLSFAGIYLTLMMAAALMGLMFLSNGTGHDEDVLDFAQGAHPLDD